MGIKFAELESLTPKAGNGLGNAAKKYFLVKKSSTVNNLFTQIYKLAFLTIYIGKVDYNAENFSDFCIGNAKATHVQLVVVLSSHHLRVSPAHIKHKLTGKVNKHPNFNLFHVQTF